MGDNNIKKLIFPILLLVKFCCCCCSISSPWNTWDHVYHSGVGSGVAPGARAPPCWIVLESFHKWKTCFAGRIFLAWSGGPSLSEPPRGIKKAWLHEDTTVDLAFGRRMRLELCCIVGIILLILKSYDFQFKASNCLTFL